MFALKQYSYRIGPAVLYGGLSTMLATVLLAFSDYYLFTAFFKVSHHIYFDIHEFRFLHILYSMVISWFQGNWQERKFFFQVFLLVVTFGLFHGLVFLPVLLCLVRTCFGLSFISTIFWWRVTFSFGSHSRLSLPILIIPYIQNPYLQVGPI